MSQPSAKVIAPPDKERLLHLLYYNPDDGWFTWKQNRNWKAIQGSRAGCLSKRTGYRVLTLDGVEYLEHRLAFFITTGLWPDQVDHINKNRADNRFCNLRESCFELNLKNKSKYTNNTSGETGIYWSKQHSRWRVQVSNKGVKKYGGLFINLADAVVARNSLQREFSYYEKHGE